MRLFRTLLFIAFTFLLFTGCKKDEENVVSNNGQVGNASNAFLSDESYTKLEVEIIYMQGHAPTTSSISNLESFLSAHLNKPEGISISLKEIPAQSQNSYSTGDLDNIENNHRSVYNEGNKITASIIFVDGSYTNENVLGVAYKNTSMAIFGGTIDDNSGGISQPSRTKLESTVLNHEFGHVLGLVNVGTDMVENHEANDHEGHCNNDNCLMYYAAETTDIASFLIGNDIPQLDNNCKQDLIANGGKE